MSKEQAKEFFEAISEDNQLAEAVREVVDGQATNHEKAKELLSLAKAHNFNFTEDELKRSLSREDLADIAGGGGALSSWGSLAFGMLRMFGIGGNGGQQPLPAPNPIINVQPAANGNAQNQDGEQENSESETTPETVAEDDNSITSSSSNDSEVSEDDDEAILGDHHENIASSTPKPANADKENEVEEIRELTPEEIAERQQREEQRRREREARLAQGPLELEESEPNWFENNGTNRLFREIDDDDAELIDRINRLNTLYYRLLYVPQSRALMDRIRNYIATRASAYNELDSDLRYIRNNDLQLAQMLGIGKKYIQEKLESKEKVLFRAPCQVGSITLFDKDVVSYKFFETSGTLVLTGSGNTVIGSRFSSDSLWNQLKEAGIVFEVLDADGRCTDEQLPTRDYPFVVRNLIIGTGITDIGEKVFLWAKSLRSVYLMGPVQFIGRSAFGGCPHLVEVGFAQPEALERIDEIAFLGAWKLVSINLPQNANIHESAFSLCTRLMTRGCPYCK